MGKTMKSIASVFLIAIFFAPSFAQVIFKNAIPTSGITTPSTVSSSFTNSWADFDNDDYWDLFIAHGNYGSDQVPQVYHNLQNGKFQEITNTAFPDMPPGYYAHMCFGDFDNDGFVDCYMDAFASSANKLWRNNGNLTFTDVSAKMLNPGAATVGTVWTDYDEDGFVDLIVSAQAGQGTMLYHNDSGKSLRVVKLFDNPETGDIVLTADINQDGWPDFYIHNDFMPDLFLTSKSGIFKTFDNSFDVNDFGVNARITAGFADVDNDGFPEIWLANNGEFNIWHNDGGSGFHDWTDSLKLNNAQKGDHRMSFMQDVDNDGYLDLILYNNLDSSEIWYGSPNGFIRTTVPFAMNTNQFPSSLSWTDYDNDGFIDFFDASEGITELWHNEGNANRWLNIKLKGHKANSMGLGSTVIAYSEGKKQYREVGFYQSYYGYQPAMAHFGFAAAGCESSAVIDSVVVIWQPGGRQVLRNVRYNELAVIDQDSGIVRHIDRPLSAAYGYAYPYFLGAYHEIPDTIATVPMAVRVPHTFILQNIKADQITFAIEYNSDVIDISPTKVAARYTPPTGWTYTSSILVKDTLWITITNSGGITLTDSLGLGTLRFDTYKAAAAGTYIYLDELVVHAVGTDYKFCHDYEGDFLGEVIVGARLSVAGGQSDGGWSLAISPNPVTGGSVNCRLLVVGGQIQGGQLAVSIFDVLGKEVYHALLNGAIEKTGVENFALPISQLAGGSYLVRVNVGGRMLTGKFTVVR